MKKLTLALVAVLMSGALGACSSSGGSVKPPVTSHSSGVTGIASATIVISRFAFSGDLTVSPGEKVTVLNKDAVAHTLTDKATMKFDTGNIAAGGTASFTAPTKAGSYPFGCRYHSEMRGTLVVT